MPFRYGANYMGGLGKQQLEAQRKTLWGASGNLQNMTGIASRTAESVNPYAESLYGPGGLNEWKRGQITRRTGDTTRGFNDALSSNRLRARMSGFGYEQPAEQQGETNIENARASELSRIPGDVEAESIPIGMNAANLRLQSGQQEAGAYGTAASGQLGIAGTQDPLGYYNNASAQYQAEQERKAAMWRSIIGAGTGIASSFIGRGAK